MNGTEQKTVLVTGASGYLGYAAAVALARVGHRVRFGTRKLADKFDPTHAWVAYGDLRALQGLETALDGCDVVVHVAGLAHVPETSESERLAREVNVEGTRRLAEVAAACGVKRFVFISSVHVNGTVSGARPFTEQDQPNPDNVYARSKLDAEIALKDIAGRAGMEWVILRPPMVYGAGAPGNFRRLVALVRTGLPLPLGAAKAPKSFLYVGNLASAVVALVTHAAAANRTFLVADNETTSTADLVRLIAKALGRKVRLVNVSEDWLAVAARAIGRERDVRRVLEPLEIDSGLIRRALGWSAPVALGEALRLTLVRE